MSVPNLDKLFQYFKCVAKEPIEFSGYCSASRNWGFIGYVSLDKITEIQINSGFFLTDTCQMCGGCCPAESNVYTKSEFEAIQNCKDEDFLDAGLKPAYLHKLRSGLIEEKYVINGSVVSVYVYKLEPNRLYLPTREKIISRCTWCYQESDTIFKCRIHPVESITCIMPHLRIFHFSGHGKSSIGLAQFGRNWALKCPIDLIEPQTEEQFENNKQNRIEKLQRLYQVGLDLNIDTYIPEVIEYVEPLKFDNYKKYLKQNILKPKQRSLF